MYVYTYIEYEIILKKKMWEIKLYLFMYINFNRWYPILNSLESLEPKNKKKKFIHKGVNIIKNFNTKINCFKSAKTKSYNNYITKHYFSFFFFIMFL